MCSSDLKQRCAEVISGGPRIDYTSLGDAARATLLESAACSLNLRARQVKESVKRGLAWTSDPKRHAKRQNLGQYFLISPQFEKFFLRHRGFPPGRARALRAVLGDLGMKDQDANGVIYQGDYYIYITYPVKTSFRNKS